MTTIIDLSSQFDIAQAPYQNVNHIAWPKGHSMDWHQHDYLQFIQVLEGRLEVDWGDGWMQIDEHHLHILPPKHKHRLRSSSGHKQFGINFGKRPDQRGLLKYLLRTFTQPCIVPSANPAIDQVFHLNPYLQIAAIDLYCSLVATNEENDQIPLHDLILYVIKKHIHEPSNVELWAEQLHMSRASAQRHCQNIFQCGLATLHHQQRMGHCASRLLSTTESIEQIAQHFGFADATCFGRAFKRHYNKTPSHWRKQARLKSA